ncbi:hypothetical protein [Polyangium sp. 15x6]|uniref:hypothetical protein n=1 Tax=Polyangium sp. 15x6 TaxID=3042687 RepID=UPI002499C5A1|nr:hypothetical protein [Polyangium sp. 15x6]MDI3284838.1 hypothetical protein [Polyangium sp. 15x6]
MPLTLHVDAIVRKVGDKPRRQHVARARGGASMYAAGMSDLLSAATRRPTFTEAVDALRPIFGEMLLIRKIRGVRLKDGRELVTTTDHDFFLYDVGVQEEDDGGATLWGWDEISAVLV